MGCAASSEPLQVIVRKGWENHLVVVAPPNAGFQLACKDCHGLDFEMPLGSQHVFCRACAAQPRGTGFVVGIPKAFWQEAAEFRDALRAEAGETEKAPAGVDRRCYGRAPDAAKVRPAEPAPAILLPSVLYGEPEPECSENLAEDAINEASLQPAQFHTITPVEDQVIGDGKARPSGRGRRVADMVRKFESLQSFNDRAERCAQKLTGSTKKPRAEGAAQPQEEPAGEMQQGSEERRGRRSEPNAQRVAFDRSRLIKSRSGRSRSVSRGRSLSRR